MYVQSSRCFVILFFYFYSARENIKMRTTDVNHIAGARDAVCVRRIEFVAWKNGHVQEDARTLRATRLYSSILLKVIRTYISPFFYSQRGYFKLNCMQSNVLRK